MINLFFINNNSIQLFNYQISHEIQPGDGCSAIRFSLFEIEPAYCSPLPHQFFFFYNFFLSWKSLFYLMSSQLTSAQVHCLLKEKEIWWVCHIYIHVQLTFKIIRQYIMHETNFNLIDRPSSNGAINYNDYDRL